MRRGSQVALGGAFVVLAGLALSGLRGIAPHDREEFDAGFDAAAVRAIQIRSAGLAVSLRKRGDAWFLHAPVEAAADSARVERLINGLAGPWAPLEHLGAPALDAPDSSIGGATRIDVDLIGPDGELLGLEVGAPQAAGGHAVRRAGGFRAVWRAHVPGVVLLSARAEDWLAPQFVEFAPDRILGLDVQTPRGIAHVRWTRTGVDYARDDGEHQARGVPDDELDSLQEHCAAWPRVAATPAEVASLASSLDSPALVIEALTEQRGRFVLRAGPPTDAGLRLVQVGDRDPVLLSAEDLDVFERLVL